MTDFETKDSGERAVFESGMQRDTQAGKPRFDLCLPEGIAYDDQLLTRFAKLMARGAEKYTERNWEQANSQAEIDRMRASGLRHFMQWYLGETDEDHAAAVLFNIMAADATAHKLELEERAAELGSDEPDEWVEIRSLGRLLRCGIMPVYADDDPEQALAQRVADKLYDGVPESVGDDESIARLWAEEHGVVPHRFVFGGYVGEYRHLLKRHAPTVDSVGDSL